MDIKDLSTFEYALPLNEFTNVSDAVRKALNALDEKLQAEGYTIPYSSPEIDFYGIKFVPSLGESWANDEVRLIIEFFCWADTADKAYSFRL